MCTYLVETPRVAGVDTVRTKLSFCLQAAYKNVKTKTVLLNFILCAVLFPVEYAKAQSELDEVVGMSRLPELDDRTSLPYVEAFLQEVYR